MEFILCPKCKLEKSRDQFAKCTKCKRGVQSRCNECGKKMAQEHYVKNKDSYLTRTKERAKSLREKFNLFKSTLKCEICGESHIATIDFHHEDSQKKDFGISRFYSVSQSRFEEELKKCKVLCSNCHRKLHWKEKNERMSER